LGAISPEDFPHAKNAKKTVFCGFSVSSPEEDSSAMEWRCCTTPKIEQNPPV